MLKIYPDRLKGGDTETIDERVAPDFFDLKASELSFPSEVIVSGQAYLANTHLVLQLKIKAKATVPCAICNETTQIPLLIEELYLTKDLDELPSAVYDYTDEVRTALLLKAPQFAECHEGNCPKRQEVKKYLRPPSAKKDDGTYHPFSDLSL
ncbi:MAG: hypothetical protein K940chlam2_00264 [Chlamydiae bacterium]|nr:hypothetical protein [Chlamydiota bacterium]